MPINAQPTQSMLVLRPMSFSKSKTPERKFLWGLPKHLGFYPVLLVLAGCDPLVSLQGSFWPPWIIVMVAALPMTAIIHAALKRLGVAEHLRPTLLVYPALWALMTFIAWLLAFPW